MMAPRPATGGRSSLPPHHRRLALAAAHLQQPPAAATAGDGQLSLAQSLMRGSMDGPGGGTAPMARRSPVFGTRGMVASSQVRARNGTAATAAATPFFSRRQQTVADPSPRGATLRCPTVPPPMCMPGAMVVDAFPR